MTRRRALVKRKSLSRGETLQAIANTFDNEAAARALLERLGFERRRMPASFVNAEQFWEAAVREIDRGIIPGGLGALVRAAADNYPHNPAFRTASAPASERADTGTSLVVSGSADVHGLIDNARRLATELGVPGPVEIGFASDENLQLRFPAATPEQVLDVARQLEQQGFAGRTTVVPNEFRDYLLRTLRVEGPDQGRYELSDVPASTRLKDVVRAVMHEYYGEIWPRDRQGQSRPAVIDFVNEDTGAHQRLDPQTTLHQSGVQEGDTLHIAPESTAGSVNPIIRDEALARVRSQVLAYAREHPGFEVLANAKTAPTEYLFRFTAPGWGPPSEPGGEPYPVDRHEVLLLLPSDFPMKAPAAFWQTPIFHPNIHRGTGKVCLGVLEDRYRPGFPFGELCQLLVDIAGYRNYEVREGYDPEARAWAMSPAGQMAIERGGGHSVMRLLVSVLDDHLREPLPLRIRRVDE